VTPRTLLAQDPTLLSEHDWSSLVVEVARLGGWTLRYHTYHSKRSPSGFPDYVFVKGARIVFAELKTEAGKLTAAQSTWKAGLLEVERATSGLVQVYTWRPGDYDAMVEVLTGRAPAVREERDG
jgi:hypothetical protein